MTTTERAGVAQTSAVLRRVRRVGAMSQKAGEGDYVHLTFEVPASAGLAAAARPGHFVALTVGGPASSLLLRRAFSLHNVVPAAAAGPREVDVFTGERPAPVDRFEIVVAAHGPGTQWLASAGEGTQVDVVGPLGRPFPLPKEPVACVLVGGGYGSAPLFWLAQALRDRGCRVEFVLGAAERAKLFGVDLAQKYGDAMVVTTDDGSMGITGWVSHVLPDVISGCEAGVVYACGPMGMLESVTKIATEHGAVAQVAVEEAMACGIGICMTCVMPVADARGTVRMVRSCVEGPVFRGDRVQWDAFEDGRCAVPPTAVGAPAERGPAGTTGGGH